MICSWFFSEIPTQLFLGSGDSIVALSDVISQVWGILLDFNVVRSDLREHEAQHVTLSDLSHDIDVSLTDSIDVVRMSFELIMDGDYRESLPGKGSIDQGQELLQVLGAELED